MARTSKTNACSTPQNLEILPFVRESLPAGCHTSLDKWAAFLAFPWSSSVIARKSVHPCFLNLLKCLNPNETHTTSPHLQMTASASRCSEDPQMWGWWSVRYCANKGNAFLPL